MIKLVHHQNDANKPATLFSDIENAGRGE